MEGAHYLWGNGSELVSLSQQALVSCDNSTAPSPWIPGVDPSQSSAMDDGCGGGMPTTAFAWVAARADSFASLLDARRAKTL